jgi:orotidine-5'-phosphate decarboxylase
VAGVGLAHGVNGPLLAPGIGPQGASAADLRAVFGPSRSSVLPTVSREVLSAGPDPDQLRKAFERTLSEVRHALGG